MTKAQNIAGVGGK